MPISARDFVVSPAKSNLRNELMAEAIKNLEPAMRERGRSVNVDLLNQSMFSGELDAYKTGDEEGVQKATDKYFEHLTDKLGKTDEF